MAVNVQPIFARRGVQGVNGGTTMQAAITAAANDFTGAGANNVLIFTAGADGSIIRAIRLHPIGTNVASLMRFFVNNGSTNGTASNNAFIGEVSLPATTASSTAALTIVEVPFLDNLALQPSFRLYMGLATAVAAGWIAHVLAGDY